MSLRFLGEWNPWLGGAAALLAAAMAWMLYRRESRRQGRRILVWGLPGVRALALFMIVAMLTGPVLHHRTVTGERGRVLVFVDSSKSMSLTDEPMDSARKLLVAARVGLLPAEALDAKLSEAADALSRARRAAGGDAVDSARLKEAVRGFAREVEQAAGDLAKVRPDTGGVALERKGVILREYWTEVRGATVAEFLKHPNFPGKPAGTSFPELLEAPSNWADHYGTRLRGFVHPPVTGNYVFWVSGDDQAELWLSPDADPARKARIARTARATEPRAWDAQPEQKSQPVRLQAGQKYYLEALQKEATANDSFAVGWQIPGGALERPIPGSRLSAPSAPVESPARALESMVARFREELLAPARALDPARPPAELTALVRVSVRWEKELRQAFSTYVHRLMAAPDARLLEAVRRFDAMPRWKRVEASLLRTGLLAKLAEKHQVEILSLSGKEAEPLWSSSRDAGAGLPQALPGGPVSETSNLADGLRARIGGRQEERVALLLFTDGQHNDGSSPLQAAKLCGSRKIRIHPVGLGGAELPDDVAVLSVKAPDRVFYKDRVKGEILLKDDMPAGRPLTVRVEHEGETLWERKLATEQSHVRSVPFDFPVQALVEKIAAKRAKGVDVLNQPVAFHAIVAGVDGEREKRNNSAAFHLHALMQRRKVLILDGRPRWETRYLRNLLDRDEQYEVNLLLAGDAGGWARGAGPGKFPPDREALYGYDLVVFGEVPRQLLKMEELEWLRDFVDKRGGGLLVLDGRRGHVGNYGDTPLGPVIPVDWKADPLSGRPSGLRVTEQGQRLGMLALASEPEKNQEIWAALHAPHWVVPSKAQRGAETLLEAAVGERRVPALVWRRLGAGRVLYAGFDETWRWRYEVADLHHSRYWNQLIRQLMERPFAVRSARVSLDAGAPVYAPGETAEIRARLRDAQGRPVENPSARAALYRDGQKAGSVALAPDENAGGVLRGKTEALPPGRYEVRLEAEGLPEGEARATTEFTVRGRDAGELAALHCNEELLKQIASQSGGEYFREEETAELPALLEPLNEERVHESDTVLWQSWMWFLPLMILFVAEWVLRKWGGML